MRNVGFGAEPDSDPSGRWSHPCTDQNQGASPTSEPADPRPRRVLVVDDDEMLREVASVALAIVGGWEVLTAGSGEEAYALAAKHLPDAILLDVMMPGVDGPTTVLTLRADPVTSAIPIIFLTAKMPPNAGTWPDLDLAGVIPKPFDPMTLPTEMSALLGWTDV